MSEGVERAVIPERLVKGRSQHQHIRSHRTAGVVADHQRAADGRNPFEASHLCPEPQFGDRCEHLSGRLDEARIPLGQF